MARKKSCQSCIYMYVKIDIIFNVWKLMKTISLQLDSWDRPIPKERTRECQESMKMAKPGITQCEECLLHLTTFLQGVPNAQFLARDGLVLVMLFCVSGFFPILNLSWMFSPWQTTPVPIFWAWNQSTGTAGDQASDRRPSQRVPWNWALSWRQLCYDLWVSLSIYDMLQMDYV